MAGPTNMPDLRARLTLDISDFTRGLAQARAAAGLFSREIESVGGHFKTAGVAMATFATISLFTAGIIATSFMAAIGVLMTLGAVSAMQAESVQNAWAKTGDHLRKGMLEAADAYVPVMERLAGAMIASFDRVKPALTQVFNRLAPEFEDLSMSFMGWIEGLINRLPASVDNMLAFMASISGAWDLMTDNMRLGWNQVTDAVVQFGPALLQNGLPVFGSFVGALLTMLVPIVESASIFAGPFFTMLTNVAVGAQQLLDSTLGQITDDFVAVSGAMDRLGMSILTMLGGLPGILEYAMIDLVRFGDIASGTIGQLGPTFTGLMMSAIGVATSLLPVLQAIGNFLVEFGPLGVALAQMVGATIAGFVRGIQPILDAMGLDWADDFTSAIIAITPAMERLGELAGQFVTWFAFGLADLTTLVTSITSGLDFLSGSMGNLGEAAGRALVIGLAVGMGALIGGPLLAAAFGVVAAVASFLPRSPAEQGPFSGDGSPEERGLRLGTMFAQGIEASTDLVSQAAGALVGAVKLPDQPNQIGSTGGFQNSVADLVSSASSVVNNYFNVEGSVLTEKELVDLVQNEALKRESRNAGSVFATAVRD